MKTQNQPTVEPKPLYRLYEEIAESKASPYDKQAQAFLEKHGIKFRATLSDSKTAPWKDEASNHVQRVPMKQPKEGHHYRVTLSKEKPLYRLYARPVYRLVFDFWGSIADAEAGITTVTPYDVLACIGSDANCPDTFKDFRDEYGYDQDSIKALQMFRRCSGFGKRLRSFFTEAELTDLQEIQ